MLNYTNAELLSKLKDSLPLVTKIQENRKRYEHHKTIYKIIFLIICLFALVPIFMNGELIFAKTNEFIGYLIIIAMALVIAGSVSGFAAHVDRHFQNVENHDFAMDNICLEKLAFLPQDCYRVEAVNYLIRELENKSSYEEAIIKYRKEVLYASPANKWTW